MFYEDHYTAHPSSSSLLLPLHKIFWYIVACGTFLDKYIFLYIFLHFKQTISKKYFLVFDSFKPSMVLRSMCPACLHPSIKSDGSPFLKLACCASLYNIIILQDGDNLIWIQLRMLCGEDKCLYGWMSRGRGSNLPVFISRTISPPIKIMKVWRLLSYAAAHNEVLLVQ